MKNAATATFTMSGCVTRSSQSRSSSTAEGDEVGKIVFDVELREAINNIKGGLAFLALMYSRNPKKAAALRELDSLRGRILGLLDDIAKEP